MYKRISTDQVVDVRNHECLTGNAIHLCCLDENGEYMYSHSKLILIMFAFTGTEHDITFMYCQCEPLVITMIRAQLWPATAQRPHLAFTFGLLDWAEALLLECQVALKDLCKALCFRCPHTCMTTKVQLFDEKNHNSTNIL